MNRAVRRLRLFEHDGDYRAFLLCLGEAQQRVPMRLLAYCVMPNHFHLVVWPSQDGELSEFMRLATVVHAKRWHAFRGTTGLGAVYQGRYKSLPVQTDHHFLTVCRYVEQNALRSELVTRAEEWPWSSLAQGCNIWNQVRLTEWPILRPADWLQTVNTVPPTPELTKLRRAIRKSRPFGSKEWTLSQAAVLGLSQSLREDGRPRTAT